MNTFKLKRLCVAVVSLLAVSAAFAVGVYSDVHPAALPGAFNAASSWVTGLLGSNGDAWNAAAAIAVMAVIAKRQGKL